MRTKSIACNLLASLALLTCAIPASAVIPLPEMPVTRIFAASKQVIIGKITSATAENRLLEIQVLETAKGPSANQRIRIQIVQPADLIQQLSAEQPAVIFVSRVSTAATIHLADTWLIARIIPNVDPPAWRVVQQADLARSFPGRTASLVRIIAAIKEGKPALLDAIRDNTLRGPVKQLAKFDIPKPTFLTAADVNADGKIDLLIGSENRIHLMLNSGTAFTDATDQWGLKNASPRLAARSHASFGNLNNDNRPDLLVGPTLLINTGNSFTPLSTISLPADEPLLAITLADATGDALADVVTLDNTGALTILQNPGSDNEPWTRHPTVKLWAPSTATPVLATFGPWSDDGQLHVLIVSDNHLLRYPLGPHPHPSDFRRLTGEKPEAFGKAFPNGLKNAIATAADFTGDNRLDYLIATDHGGLLMINRGFGAYFINPDIALSLQPTPEKPRPFKLGPAVCCTSADLQADRHADLLILTDDGTLWQIDNTPANP